LFDISIGQDVRRFDDPPQSWIIIAGRRGKWREGVGDRQDLVEPAAELVNHDDGMTAVSEPLKLRPHASFQKRKEGNVAAPLLANASPVKK
jgi:hypothetical protein